MPWETSDRRDRLPPDWGQRVQRVKDRDGHRCTKILKSGKRCPRGRSTGHQVEIDHKIPNDDHRLSNLRCLCVEHHKQKTAKEAKNARFLPPTQKRREPHPGLWKENT